jgi:hypothetical protein
MALTYRSVSHSTKTTQVPAAVTGTNRLMPMDAWRPSGRARSQNDAKRRTDRCIESCGSPPPGRWAGLIGLRAPCMREVMFRVVGERPGHLEAQAGTLPIRIAAPTLEELQHEARESLINHVGPAHGT